MKRLLFRFTLISLLGVGLMTLYLALNHRSALEFTSVLMPEWAPFWPLLALPYLAMLIAPFPLILALQDQERFYRSLGAVTVGFAMIAAIWIFFPTVMHRPEFELGWQNQVYGFLVQQDNPVNILPCGHVLWPTIAVYFLGQERSTWLWWLVPFLLFGMVTVVATWQHRPVDVAIGTGISFGAIWLSEQVGRKNMKE
jgi:hypothetical protein